MYGTHEPDKGAMVLPGRVFGKKLARGRLRDDGNACNSSEGICGRRGEDLVYCSGCIGHRWVSRGIGFVVDVVATRRVVSATRAGPGEVWEKRPGTVRLRPLHWHLQESAFRRLLAYRIIYVFDS